MFISSSLEESNTPLINTLPMGGNYTLIIFLSKEIRIEVGQLGVKKFPGGYYTYTGSALGAGASNLKQRVLRHLRKAGKKKRWHIDFLLAHRNATVAAVVAAQTYRNMECKLNCYSRKKGNGRIPIPGFGSSDCRRNCRSHLIFFPDITKEQDLLEKTVKCYADLGLTPLQITVPSCAHFGLLKTFTRRRL